MLARMTQLAVEHSVTSTQTGLRMVHLPSDVSASDSSIDVRETSLAEGANTSIEVRDDGSSIVVSRGGAWLCRARARVQGLPARNLGLGGRLLILDEFAACKDRVLESESNGALPVLRDLLRCAKTNAQRPWHVLRVDARSDQRAVVIAAWQFALEWDMACDVAWGGDDIVSVSLYGHGARAAVARLASQLGGFRKATSMVRRRISGVAISPRVHRPGTALFLGLDLGEVTSGTGIAGVVFRPVDLKAVARRPLLYADTVLGAEVLLEGGEECFVGQFEGRTIFRMWVGAVEPRSLAGVEPSVARKRCRYLHESHTVPGFRNRGIRTAALRWLAPRLRDLEYEMLWLHVMPDNAPAIRSAEKVGFRRMRT